jgi:Ohr subfamily peroxiredoxin
MNVLYRTKVLSTGGRNGKVSIDNSPLAFNMTPPKEMGGSGTGANPEQLFAAGYSACFGSALQHVIREKKLNIPAPDVQITVGIGQDDTGGYILNADIVAIITGVDQAAADALAAEAHQVCPYSKATRGNIEVTVSARVK